MVARETPSRRQRRSVEEVARPEHLRPSLPSQQRAQLWVLPQAQLWVLPQAQLWVLPQAQLWVLPRAPLWALRQLRASRLPGVPLEQKLETKKAQSYRAMRPVPIDN